MQTKTVILALLVSIVAAEPIARALAQDDTQAAPAKKRFYADGFWEDQVVEITPDALAEAETAHKVHPEAAVQDAADIQKFKDVSM